ncbi:MAG: GntR family transcriptional regulator [Gammaproteobacteria bacterium]|nr:GntR family transcriptional regulator [Gammaproteobacteria bacterium]MBU0787428.1 GntR family transcriptional regulator [Gammaproteobacteria bacterium]MBU0815102.1 GntR family transcriptional regulator [Gammaproteobacteria bacterium]MBU1785790.1 GntR family transcriptional regulator [Gammaproteobacteria bacterium]
MARPRSATASPPARPLRLDKPAGESAEPASIEDRIYQSIFEGVMSQRLAPGTKLPEASLCEIFDTSRPTVRQALKRLAHDSIVQIRPNRGAIVAIPTPEETQQIFEARRGLEAALVKLAIEHATKADFKKLRAQLKQEHEAMHRFDQPAWARLASNFHLQVGALGRNPILLRYLAEIVSRCSLIVAVYEPPGNAICEHDEHVAIVDCIERGDAEKAVRLMDQHLHVLQQNICLKSRPRDTGLKQLLGL